MVAAQTLTLRPDEALLTAQAAYQAGDFALANYIARALLLVDPNDPLVLLLISATEAKLGHTAAGLQAGRKAWSEARSRKSPDHLRWEIARNTAKTAYDADRLGLAQLWLRRSLDVAPDAVAKTTSGRDLADLRRQNPLRWNLGVSVGPTDNLNGGASDLVFRIDDTVVGTLGAGSGAIAGTRARIRFGAQYALPAGQNGQTVLGVTAGLEVNRIDPGGAAAKGNLRARDLNQTSLAFSLRRDIPRAFGAVPLSLEVRTTGTWAGGKWVGPSVGGTVAAPLFRSDASNLWLAASAERRWTSGATDTIDTLHLTAFGDADVTAAARLSYSLSFERNLSDRTNASFDAVSLTLGYDPGWSLGPADIDLSLRLGHRRYDTFSLGFAQVTKGRTDHFYGMGVDITLPRLDVMGFAPVISVDLGKTRSNVSRYETDTRGIGFSFEQVF